MYVYIWGLPIKRKSARTSEKKSTGQPGAVWAGGPPYQNRKPSRKHENIFRSTVPYSAPSGSRAAFACPQTARSLSEASSSIHIFVFFLSRRKSERSFTFFLSRTVLDVLYFSACGNRNGACWARRPPNLKYARFPEKRKTVKS